MWNSAGRLALNPRPPLAEYPYFKKMLADIKGLNANLV